MFNDISIMMYHFNIQWIVSVKITNHWIILFFKIHLDANQFLQENNDEDTSITQSSNVEHEQDENDQTSMSIVYKKRVRTKFSQEQV